MTLEERIEAAAEKLPEGWRVNIEVEKGSALVRLIRPDETELIVDDGESELEELFRDACIVARDEDSLKRGTFEPHEPLNNAQRDAIARG